MRVSKLMIALAIVVELQPWAKMEQREGAMLAEASEVSTNVRLQLIADEKTLPLEWGSEGYMLSVTADEFIERNYAIDRGFVCVSNRDIKCVQGLCGDEEHYWSLVINGDSQNASLKTLVKPGDVVELVYKKKSQKDHERLQDWLLSSARER